jgi:hypothetical protein
VRCTPKGIDATNTFNPIESELDSKQVDKRETRLGEGTRRGIYDRLCPLLALQMLSNTLAVYSIHCIYLRVIDIIQSNGLT